MGTFTPASALCSLTAISLLLLPPRLAGQEDATTVPIFAPLDSAVVIAYHPILPRVYFDHSGLIVIRHGTTIENERRGMPSEESESP